MESDPGLAQAIMNYVYYAQIATGTVPPVPVPDSGEDEAPVMIKP
jgi:hypothetical protein